MLSGRCKTSMAPTLTREAPIAAPVATISRESIAGSVNAEARTGTRALYAALARRTHSGVWMPLARQSEPPRADGVPEVEIVQHRVL